MLKSTKENLNFENIDFLRITSVIGASSLSLNNCKEATASSSLSGSDGLVAHKRSSNGQ